MMENQDCSKKLESALCEANNRYEEQKSRLVYSKTDTQKALIEPIINALGWDTTDESQVIQKCILYGEGIEEEMDYALFADDDNDTPLIKIESQKLGSIKNAERKIEYYNDVPDHINVATDGFCWSIYNNKIQSKITIDSNTACKELSKHLDRSIVMQSYIQKQKFISKYISDEFQNILKDYKIPSPSKEDIQNRINANKAVELFSIWTLQNNDKLDTPDNFLKIMHVYRNILFWNTGVKKKTLPIKLNKLRNFGLKSNLIDKITKLAEPGRYMSIQRRFEDFSYSSNERNMFFKLINAFIVTDTNIDKLYNMITAFASRLQIGTAALTGIVAALRPEEFMVYNSRSTVLIDELDPDNGFKNIRIESYPEFNDLYKKISKETNKSLIHLDYVTNKIFLCR